MTWLNSSLLPFLAAAGIPLLLYLLSRRKLPKIPFSSIRFLKLLEKKQHRRVNITQWLLILLRILAILCIVAAFARPLSVGAFPVGSPANAEITIVLDRSASMAAHTAAGSPFDQAVRVIRQFANTLTSQDKITLLFADDLDSNRIYTSLPVIKSALDGESPKTLPDNIAGALARAERILRVSSAPFRSLILLTDGVGQNDTLSIQPVPNIRYFRWTPPEISTNNLAISDIQQLEPLLDASSGVTVRTTVHSYAENPQSTAIKLSIASPTGSYEAIGEQNLDMAAHSERSVDWIVKPQGSGPWRLRAELLTEDLLSTDNSRDLSIPAQRQRAVAVSGDPSQIRIIAAGLAAMNIGVAGVGERTSTVAIHAGKRPPLQSAQQWRTRLETGESLWLIPASDADVSEWNRWLLAANLPQLQTYQSVGRSRYPLNKDQLASCLRAWVKSPDIAVGGRWSVSSASISSLNFADGASAWIDQKDGKGYFRLETIPVTGAGWETEPLRIPLLARGLAMLQGVDAAPSVECSASVPIPDEFRTSVRWTSPSGTIEFADLNRIHFTEPGFWRDDSNRIWTATFPCNESNRNKRTRFGGIADSTFKPLPNSPEAAITSWKQTRDGREWRSYLLAMALLLLVSESVIGRSANK